MHGLKAGLLFAVVLAARPGRADPIVIDDFDVTKPLDQKELKKLPPDELRFLRNSIYARHGRTFEAASLATLFASRDWYRRDAEYSDARLSAVEKANVDLIAKAEKARGGAWSEPRYLEWIHATLSQLAPAGAVGIKGVAGGKWEVPLSCGRPAVTMWVSQSAEGVSIDEEYVEGHDAPYTFVVLLRAGADNWVGLGVADPKKEVSIQREGSHLVIGESRYASPKGLRTRETISAKDCRVTGH